MRVVFGYTSVTDANKMPTRSFAQNAFPNMSNVPSGIFGGGYYIRVTVITYEANTYAADIPNTGYQECILTQRDLMKVAKFFRFQKNNVWQGWQLEFKNFT